MPSSSLPLQICPRWIAPNVLTFVGFLFTVNNFVLLSIYDYSYYASSAGPLGDKYPPIPSWVWLACAFNHFMAHTLGKSMAKNTLKEARTGQTLTSSSSCVVKWFMIYTSNGYCLVYKINVNIQLAVCLKRMITFPYIGDSCCKIIHDLYVKCCYCLVCKIDVNKQLEYTMVSIVLLRFPDFFEVVIIVLLCFFSGDHYFIMFFR